jgi:GWxTD domain-containing protein
MPRWFALLATLAIAGPAGAYTIDLPPLPDPDLAEDALFARIDSLEAGYLRAVGTERADLAARLGVHYLATGLSSHELTAQNYLKEAWELNPARTDAVYWSAIALQQSGYYTMARRRMEELLAREPDDLDHLIMLARLEFVESRLRYHKHDVSAAYQLFLRALALAPDRTHVLIGAGSTALLAGNLQLARSCGERLRSAHPERIEGWYLHAASDFRMGNVETAWVDYLKAISHAPKEERDIFLGGSILVRDEELAGIAAKTVSSERARKVPGAVRSDGKIDWVEAVTDPGIRAAVLERWWMRRDPSPSAFENEGELEYWTRLVEADLIFGRPDAGIRGWETLPGEVWVRLGRPLSQYHWLPETENDARSQGAKPPASVVDRGYRSLTVAAPAVFWDWGYVIDGVPVTMRFVDESYGQPLWAIGPGSGVDLGKLRTEMAFVEPTRRQPRGTIELHASVARFPRGTQSLLETSLTAHCPQLEDLAAPPIDSVIVEWTLMTRDEALIDQERKVLSVQHRLSTLLAISQQGAVPARRDPFLGIVGARLDAGEYRIKVRAINPRTGVFTAKTFDVNVPGSGPGGPFALSSIQLSHGLSEWDRSDRLPPEFVKHGRVVLSAADATIEGNSLGVFYELENAGRDEAGQTEFDVEYAIYEATGQVRLLAMLGTFDPAELEEVELSTVQYLRERTGVSPEGLVVKGTEIDISALREGDYVLQIRVDDLVTGQTAAETVAFRKPSPSRSTAVVRD